MHTINIFPWNENFNTGIEIIDEQHHKLVDILNSLASQLAQKADETTLQKILQELSDYTIYHFETEEHYWNKYFKGDLSEKEHKEFHATFIKKIALLKEEQSKKPLVTVVEDALEFLTNWLASHILETDREMAYRVSAIERGKTVLQAKQEAREKMNDSSHIFIQIILSIYSTLSQNTLKLIKELKLNEGYDETLLYENEYRELLLELSTSFINSSLIDDDEREVTHALEKMANFLKVDRAYLFEYDPTHQTLTNTHHWSTLGIIDNVENLCKITISSVLECYEIHKNSKPITINDVSKMQESQFKASLENENIQSLVSLPLINKDECYGFVGFDSIQKLHTFTDSELTLLRLFSQLLENLKERKESQKSLQLAASVFKNSSEGIFITSAENIIVDANEAVSKITGYKREELIGKNPKVLSSGKNEKSLYKEMWKSLGHNDAWSGEIWNRKKDGEIYAELLSINVIRNEQNAITNYLAFFSDITTLKEHENSLEYLAHYDVLTGLPNRILLGDRIKSAIEQVRRKESTLAIIYLDLDGFKEINDAHGHDCGDTLLIMLSKSMKELLRENDTLARIGGDEFIIVLNDLISHQKSIPFLEKLLDSVSQTKEINDKKVTISASLGVSFFDASDNIEADQLLRQADQAMYQAKLAGKNQYHIFDPIEDATIRSHHQKISSIKEALKCDEFKLYYQPKINMKTGKVFGFEALIRWRHPKEGLLSPALFLPYIEEDSMSIVIGEWVLEEACKEILRLKEQNFSFNISVNINAIHLLQGNFIAKLKEMLEKYPEINEGDLTIEILETSALEDLEQVSSIIKEAQSLGIYFALDDFGTGYSSLTYLKKLDVKQIKIDQSFIRDMLIDSDDLAIIEGVITLSSAFRREIIAEGVESIEHGEILLQLGCELAQGYAIAKPMPAEEIENWLQSYTPEPRWQNTKRLQRDKITYLHAIVEQRAWFNKTLLSLQNRDFDEISLDSQKCNFGVWIQNHPDENTESFKVIQKTHSELHELATQLITQAKREDIKDFEPLKEKSEELLLQLKEMALI